MTLVLTLIGNATTALTQSHIDAARAVLPTAGQPDWLAPGLACDISFDGRDPVTIKALIDAAFQGYALDVDMGASLAKAAEAKVRQALRGTAIDIAVQPVEGRRKKLLVADMDSTIIEQECIDELATELGIGPKIAAITESAMRGEIAFEPALRERVRLLKGLPVESLERVYTNRITETPGGKTLIATMRAHGAFCALVSGGFTYFTGKVAAAVGFNINQANLLLIEDGVLTGEVAEPILGREAKIEALVRFRAERGLSDIETMAVGDGANDLGMIDEAGLGVAFHAKPVVAEAADARIDHGDLTALLYLQGYRQSEITAA